jgi:hypothetical protein
MASGDVPGPGPAWLRMRVIITGLLLALVVSACVESSRDRPGEPSSTVANIAGTWRGSLTVQGTAMQMTWALAQTNATVSGTAIVTLASGTVLLNGTLSGTVTGTTLTYSIAVGPGGVPSQPACTGQLGGTASLVGTSPVTALNGSYSVVSSSCPIPLTTGTLSLTR